MLSIILSSIIMSVTLPASHEIETISSGQQAVVDVSSGSGWVRILEDDYVCLEVSAPEGIDLKACDANGNNLCQSISGSAIVISAFSDYWFYLYLEPDENYHSNSAVLDVQEVSSTEITPDGDAVSVLGNNVMAETYTFSPEIRGSWTFRLV